MAALPAVRPSASTSLGVTLRPCTLRLRAGVRTLRPKAPVMYPCFPARSMSALDHASDSL